MHSTKNGNVSVSVQPWCHPDLFLFTLTNTRGMSLSVTNYGAAVVSCIAPDTHGKYKDVVLGYDAAEDYINDDFYIGTVVGRFANRINGPGINISGKEFLLADNRNGFHHHGGFSGFNKKTFSAKPIETDNGSGLSLSYTSKDGEEGYPGNLSLTVKYTLNDKNSWTVEYVATTDKPTIVNLTQHSYFNLAGHNSGSVENQYLQINADAYLPVDSNFIPTGQISSVAGTIYDLRKLTRLGTNINEAALSAASGYDNSWVLEREHQNTLKHAASAMDPESGRTLNVYTTEPSVHFYSGNFIADGTRGKGGAVYNKRSGFCLETQHFPDSPHHPSFPSAVLLPDEQFFSKTVFSFSTA